MNWDNLTGSLDFQTLRSLYATGDLCPRDVVKAVFERIRLRGEDSVWIYLEDEEKVLKQAEKLENIPAVNCPLWGIPFSVKDCNDVPGMPTTNAFKPMEYIAESTGSAMQRILDAGALCIGKVNMDQFGIGLVGMRSPYGECASVFNPAYISGGSSSGSGISVGAGEVSFSFANDAAGSGRVPAAFNNIVGMKPTPGVVSNSSVSGGGVVRTIESIAFFALTVEDGIEIMQIAGGYDPNEAFSRPEADSINWSIDLPERFSFAVPRDGDLFFDGDNEAARLYLDAVHRMESLGGTPYAVSMQPFADVRGILYHGPWISERGLVMDSLVEEHRDQIFPVTREILSASSNYSAADVFRAIHTIEERKKELRPLWNTVDFMLVPTTPTTYTRDQIRNDPFELNTKLGTYTNFVNLMKMCGVAVPNGFRNDGIPQGLTLLGPSFSDGQVAGYAARYHRAVSREGICLASGKNPHPFKNLA